MKSERQEVSQVRCAFGKKKADNLHGSHVGQVAKDLVGSDGESHVGEATETGGDDDGEPGKTVLGSSGEDLGEIAVESDTVESPTGGVEIGRGGGPGRGDETGVDDGREDLDTGFGDGDDEGRGGGVRGSSESLVVGSDDETDHECSEDVEDEDSDVDSLDGSGKVSSGVLSLSGAKWEK